MKKTLFFLFLLPSFAFAQIPPDYYSGTSTLSGYALKSKLHDIISNKTINWHYGDLIAFYGTTDLDRYYDHDATNTSFLLDMYSEIPSGVDAYEYTVANSIGSANAEGQGWNREHIMPQSTFDSNYPMYSDLYFVIPTDARINQLRSNYPYGKAGATNYYTFTNSSKISNNATANSGYTGRVYEPIDEFKGDIARSLLYFSVRYEGKLATFNFYNGTSAANDRSPLDGTEEKAFEDWYISLLLQWHNQDPVSQRELDRNDAVFALQKNRNPFVDYPQWVNSIWSQTFSIVIPDSPLNLGVAQNSAYFIKLNWTPSAQSDVLGYKIYQNGVLVGTSKGSETIIDHLDPETTYNFTVRSFNTGYLESTDSNVITVSTASTDIYAKDLMITKYLEGSGNNKALEITNKTGHAIDLNKYRLSIQFNGNNAYYFPKPFELEGIVQNNETFVVLNPTANFSCITNDEAKLVTAAPQMTYTGSQFIELRYNFSTVDAIGTRDINNFDVLGNVSLYRLNSVNQPTTTFNLSEWKVNAVDYCENIGVLATSNITGNSVPEWTIYPNPIVGDTLFVKGKNLDKMQSASIIDISGRMIQKKSNPFKNTNSIDVSQLKSGVYILRIGNESMKFIKN